MRLVRECRSLWRSGQLELPARTGSRRVLVTPLGFSPGVVYSAVVYTRPDHLLVVSSSTARQRLSEVLEQAGYAALPNTVIEMVDAYGGFDESRQINDRVAGLLVKATEAVINLTGGTTAMHYMVERIAGTAQRLGVRTRTIAVVDRRPLSEQQAQPYSLGELVDVDALESGPREQVVS